MSDDTPRLSVLIIDDDPVHLRIYGWIVDGAGYTSVPALVHLDGIDLPEEHVDLVLLDYHLTGSFSAVDAAGLIRRRFPDAPILVLSDAYGMPDDIEPLVNGFVRKGDPAKLVQALGRYLRSSNEP